MTGLFFSLKVTSAYMIFGKNSGMPAGLPCVRQIQDIVHYICRGDLGLVIQVGVDVRRGGKVAVSEPLLNMLKRHAVGQQQAGAAVSEVVKAHPAQAVTLQEFWECRGQIIGPHPLAQLVHKYKSIIFVIVTVAAYSAPAPPLPA